MISVRPDTSARPSTLRSHHPGISQESSPFSTASSPSTSPAIVAPQPSRPNASDHQTALLQESRPAPSASPPPLINLSVSDARSFSESPHVHVSPESIKDVSLEIYVNDEGLNPVERIYLLSRSSDPMHRVFMSRSLHTFLPEVSPSEAVEYVLPLLIGLACDDEDAVKEALITSLVDIMWWFLENCQLVEDEPPDEQVDPPLLPVQTFTPILGTLLIDHNARVGAPARFAIVEILNRLHSADDRGEDNPPFGSNERKMLEQEIVHQVVIGMGRLDVSEDTSLSPVSKAELTPTVSSPVPTSSSTDKKSSQLSSSGCQSFLSSTTQLDASDPLEEPCLPTSRPSRLSPDMLSSTEPLLEPSSSTPHERSFQVSLASASSPDLKHHDDTLITSCSRSSPEGTFGETATKTSTNEVEGRSRADAQQFPDTQEETREQETKEQAAIGRLLSMSLIATVTAHAKLPEDTIRAFADEVAYIGADPLCWVRREASFAVGALAKVVPVEVVFLVLLPLFQALVQDAIGQVRHSAVFALPGILTRLAPQHRRTLAMDILLNLSCDEAFLVRSGVLEVLGEVIYAFREDDGGAPQELVSLFVGRERGVDWRQHKHGREPLLSDPLTAKAKSPPPALSSISESDDGLSERSEAVRQEQVGKIGPTPTMMMTPGDFFPEHARSLITSFNYPAVALSLGPRRWCEVRECYLTLTRDTNIRVRRTLAASLGELARILGSELTQRDLIDVWQDMVHDAEDAQTRLKALGGVCPFVSALEGPAREGIVMGFLELWERWLTGWRERECLILAMPTLAVLAQGQEEVVRTLMGKALMDKMAAVREAAVGAITHVFRAFESRPHIAEEFRDDLQALSCMDCSRRRATYVACCQAMTEGEHGKMEIARDEFWKYIVLLSEDRVIDVRIGVARLLGVLCEKFYPHPSTRSPRLIEIIRRLSQDPSRDVRAFVAFLLIPEEVSQLRHTPTNLAMPPLMFATFSRPPPKTPSLIVRIDMQDLRSGDEDSPMELTSQASTGLMDQVLSPTTIPEGEDPLVSSDMETKD